MVERKHRGIYDECRQEGWLGRFGEDRRGHGGRKKKKKKKKARNPWESSASELEKDETDRLGEDSLGEEACMAVLDDLSNKARKEWRCWVRWREKMRKWCEEIMPQRSARQGGSWEFQGSSGWWNGEWKKTKK